MFCVLVKGDFMSDDEFREDLVDILVNGIDLSFMQFTNLEEVADFGEQLVKHYMEDDRLEKLFFWLEDYVIMHDEFGCPSTFGVLLTGSKLLFRTESGSIDNHKNAGRILMATINFVGMKLETLEKAGYIEFMNKSEDESEEDTEEKEEIAEEESESESESDFWL